MAVAPVVSAGQTVVCSGPLKLEQYPELKTQDEPYQIKAASCRPRRSFHPSMDGGGDA